MTSYADRLKDPRWQRRRLEILSRAGFSCEECGAEDRTLHVHHKLYRKRAMPWEYSDDELTALCENCHEHTEQWRTLLSEAISRVSLSDLEAVVGYVEATVARSQMDFPEDIRPEISLAVRSYEHAYGISAALNRSARAISVVADCICDLRVLGAKDISDLLGGKSLRTPEDRG